MKIKNKKKMEEIKLYQLKTIQEALRLTSKMHNCSSNETAFDRTVTKAKKFVENALDGKID